MSLSIRPRGWRSSLVLTALALGLFVAPARGQDDGEFDRAKEPTQRHDPLATPAPIDSRFQPLRPSGPRVDSDFLTPEELKQFPKLPEPERRHEPSWIELKTGGKVFASSGFDTNVFRGERGTTGDGFTRGHGEVDLLGRFRNGGEVFLEVTGETLLYFEHPRANESFVSTFLEYYQPAFEWLDVGVQNAFEWSRLNLLDDNGDLFPRGRFGSFDEEVRLFAILTPPVQEHGDELWQWRSLALELGASFRSKDYEENTGVDSLDYEELRFDAALTYRISRSPRARVKLKYRFRRRDYREFRARDRFGGIGPNEPHLDLQRHQLNLRYFQDIRFRDFQARLILGIGGAYNRDLHENDRSYREASASLSVEWWILERTTRLDVGVRGLGRNFLVRKKQIPGPLGTDVPSGARLRHRLLRLRVGLWRRLYSSDKGGAGKDASRPGFTLAAFSDVSITVWRSGDTGEDYDRYVWQAGLEASW